MDNAMLSTFYGLHPETHAPTPIPALMEEFGWTIDECSQSRRVADTTIDGVRVSTVCLAFDHGCGNREWFETMMFGGSRDNECWRYETYEQALAGHALWVEEVRRG